MPRNVQEEYATRFRTRVPVLSSVTIHYTSGTFAKKHIFHKKKLRRLAVDE